MATSKKSKFLLSEMVAPAADPVREELGSYWIVDDAGKFQRGTSSFGTGKFTSVQWDPHTINQDYEKPPYYTITQTVTLISDSTRFPTGQDFRNYILGVHPVLGERPGQQPFIVTGTMFGDAGLTLGIPYSTLESKVLENVPKQEVYQVSPNYNFFQKAYEVQTQTAPEILLPDLYTVYQASQDDEKKNPMKDMKSRLGTYARMIGNTRRPEIKPTVDLLPIENTQFLNAASAYKSSFPMCNEISFPTQINTRFAEILKDAEMSTEFLNFLSETNTQPTSFTGYREEFSVSKDGSVVFVSPNGQGDFNTYDIFTWWEDVLREFGPAPSQRQKPPPKKPSIIGPRPEKINKFSKFLHLLTFEGKMQELVNDYLRTYIDILKGAPSHSETVAYKLEKRKSGKLISTYLFPNSNEIDVYNFVDTQVKYSQTYQYQAFAYQLVLGSEYKYNNVKIMIGDTDITDEQSPSDFLGEDNAIGSNPDSDDSNSNFLMPEINIPLPLAAKFDVSVRPSVKIVELPLFSAEAAVYDSLPIPPEINFLPLKGKSGKIKILLNSGTGEYKMSPIIINPDDSFVFSKIAKSLKLPPGAPLPFRSDDPPSQFQIFRITKHPEKYSDFAGKMIRTVDTFLESKGIHLSSSTIIEGLKPNTKYYYTFRVIDIHGKMSNPSAIFKIELVDEKGAIYLLVESVELEKTQNTQLSKGMKQIFNIVPRMAQGIFDASRITDMSTANGLTSARLGLIEENLWGKKFKIRLISKKSGKKVDLNIIFKTEQVPVK